MLQNVVKVSLLILLVRGAFCFGDDWPQFRGLRRDGICYETRLLKKWPVGGPELLWSISEDLGTGFSSAAIADGLIYVTGMIDNKGILFAFDLEGKLKWKREYGAEWTGQWPGTRATPTIEKEKLYLMSGTGAVFCYQAKTGELIWSRDVAKEYEGIVTDWGWAESLLIVDEKVICTISGKKATMAALDKATGKTVWDKPSFGQPNAYCSAILVERGGRKIIVNRTDFTFFGVDATDGMVLWQYDCDHFMQPAIPPHVNPNLPLYHDGEVYITSGYDAGGAMFSLSEDGSEVELKWSDKTLDVHHGGVVLVDGYIYGANWARNGKSEWVSLNWKTGEPRYTAEWNNHQGATIYADGMLYCYDEKTGELALVKAGAKFEVVSSFKIPKARSQFWWAHPSISEGRLYVRHDKTLRCYDIKAKDK